MAGARRIALSTVATQRVPPTPSASSFRKHRRYWTRPAARRRPADAPAAGAFPVCLRVRTAPWPEGADVFGACRAEQDAALGAVWRQGDHDALPVRVAPPRERKTTLPSARLCTPP